MKFTPMARWRTRASPGPGLADVDVLEPEHLGPAGLVEADCAWHPPALTRSRAHRMRPSAASPRERVGGQAGVKSDAEIGRSMSPARSYATSAAAAALPTTPSAPNRHGATHCS